MWAKIAAAIKNGLKHLKKMLAKLGSSVSRFGLFGSGSAAPQLEMPEELEDEAGPSADVQNMMLDNKLELAKEFEPFLVKAYCLEPDKANRDLMAPKFTDRTRTWVEQLNDRQRGIVGQADQKAIQAHLVNVRHIEGVPVMAEPAALSQNALVSGLTPEMKAPTLNRAKGFNPVVPVHGVGSQLLDEINAMRNPDMKMRLNQKREQYSRDRADFAFANDNGGLSFKEAFSDRRKERQAIEERKKERSRAASEDNTFGKRVGGPRPPSAMR